MLGWLVLFAFVLLLPFLFAWFAAVAVVLLLVAVFLALVIYIRVRLALRRFRRDLERSQAARPGGTPGPSTPPQDAIDAEFEVKDGR